MFCLLLVSCCLRFNDRCALFVGFFRLLVMLSSVVRCLLLVVIVVRCLLCVVCSCVSLFVVVCLLFVV